MVSTLFSFIYKKAKSSIRLDRNEIAGAFGGMGTDLPLLVGLITSCGLDAASVFIMYGIMHMISGFYYGIPMAVQPLKLVATLAISAHYSSGLVLGSGIMIGVLMLFLSGTKLLKWFSVVVPVSVIRGVQFGLGLTLAKVALLDYLGASSGYAEWMLVAFSVLIIVAFKGNRTYPAALGVVLCGFVFSLVYNFEDMKAFFQGLGFYGPKLFVPTQENLIQGFLLLTIPQISLSIGNSVLATERLSNDLFPEKKISSSKIGFSYAFMNIISPFFGGIPVCHGSGGLAGHYTFGARTGGSVFFYGVCFMCFGIFFSHSIESITVLFPYQVLGVLLAVEAYFLLKLIGLLYKKKSEFILAVGVGIMAWLVPYGFLISMLLGTLIYHFFYQKK